MRLPGPEHMLMHLDPQVCLTTASTMTVNLSRTCADPGNGGNAKSCPRAGLQPALRDANKLSTFPSLHARLWLTSG